MKFVVHIGVPATFSLLKRLQAHLKGKKSPFAHHKIKENLNLHTLTQVATLGLDRAKITKVPDPLDPLQWSIWLGLSGRMLKKFGFRGPLPICLGTRKPYSGKSEPFGQTEKIRIL